MSITLAAATTQVRDLVDEPSAAFWTDAQIKTWLNAGVREVARRSEWKRTSTSVSVTAGTQIYTGPTDMIRIYRIEWQPSGSSTKYRLEYRDINAMDAIWGVNQSIGQGIPEFYTLVAASPVSIELSPTPSSNGALKVYYYQMPADLATDGTADSSTLSVPNGWEDLPVEWAVALAYRKSHNAEQYQLAMTHFNSTLSELMEMATRFTDEPTAMVQDVGPWGSFGLMDAWY